MSLVCERCNQAKATVHITDTTPETREQHLCEDCAEREGVIIKPHQTTNDILQQFIKHKPAQDPLDDVTCTHCGTTFRTFQVNGQLGCPKDYQVFGDLLRPLIARAHEGATHHIGKVPATADATTQKQSDLLRLRDALSEALEKENYERAAEVRDQLSALESS